MSSPADTAALGRWLGAAAPVPAADVRIVTSGGRSIPAHSIVLASASAVLERKLDRLARRGGAGDNCKALLVLGVPCDAVEVFVRMIYTAAGDEAAAEGEGVGRYGFHLLALAHVYRVEWMKRACEAALAARLTAEAVVDVLQLARMCDAPKLAVRCLRFVAREFAAVQQTEGWGWVRANDPRLELEILRFVEDTDMSTRNTRTGHDHRILSLGAASDLHLGRITSTKRGEKPLYSGEKPETTSGEKPPYSGEKPETTSGEKPPYSGEKLPARETTCNTYN